MAAKPTGSWKSPSKPARLLTGQAQGPNDLLRIGCHVMPFPPHPCMNRYQSGNSGPQTSVDQENIQHVML